MVSLAPQTTFRHDWGVCVQKWPRSYFISGTDITSMSLSAMMECHFHCWTALFTPRIGKNRGGSVEKRVVSWSIGLLLSCMLPLPSSPILFLYQFREWKDQKLAHHQLRRGSNIQHIASGTRRFRASPAYCQLFLWDEWAYMVAVFFCACIKSPGSPAASTLQKIFLFLTLYLAEQNGDKLLVAYISVIHTKHILLIPSSQCWVARLHKRGSSISTFLGANLWPTTNVGFQSTQKSFFLLEYCLHISKACMQNSVAN